MSRLPTSVLPAKQAVLMAFALSKKSLRFFRSLALI
ncbi:unnamed protein product [Tenebrio molitor]|nr:unnamed protein product [Tenebrio molitor]